MSIIIGNINVNQFHWKYAVQYATKYTLWIVLNQLIKIIYYTCKYFNYL